MITTAMMTRKSLPRRAFLRGVGTGIGTAVALPFLDAMVPAFAAPRTAAPPVRMAFVYVPNGIIMATGIRTTRALSPNCRASSSRWSRSRTIFSCSAT